MLDKIKEAITGLFGSKKFWSAVIASLIAAGADHFGVDQGTIYAILGVFGVQIGGQGLADHGKVAAAMKRDDLAGALEDLK